MTGGIKFEHTHRMIAELVGLLTIIFAVWTQRRERRSWMRKLGWTALALVIVQGVLGGITVLTFLPWYVSTAHATVAQTFFALAVLFFVFTSTDWTEKPRVMARNSGGTHKLAVLAVCAVYFQLITGAGFRHHGFSVMWHVLGAAVAAIILIWTAGHVLRHYDSPALRTPAKALLALVFIQLGLGVTVYFTRVIWGKDAPQPLPSMVYSTVAHVATGALVLACAVVLLAQAYRNVARENTLEPIPAKAVAV